MSFVPMIKTASLTSVAVICAFLLSGTAGAQSVEQMRAVYAEGRFVEAAELGAALKTSESYALAAQSLAIQGHFFAKGREGGPVPACRGVGGRGGTARCGQSGGAHPTGPHHGPVRPGHRVPAGGHRGYATRVRESVEEALRLTRTRRPVI